MPEAVNGIDYSVFLSWWFVLPWWFVVYEPQTEEIDSSHVKVLFSLGFDCCLFRTECTLEPAGPCGIGRRKLSPQLSVQSDQGVCESPVSQ